MTHARSFIITATAMALLAACLLLAVPGQAADQQLWNRPTVTGRAVAVSPDSTLIAATRGFGQVGLYQVSDGSLVRVIAGNTPPLNALAFSSDGTLLATSQGSGVDIFSTTDGSLLRTLPEPGGSAIAFSANGQFLATTYNGTISIWRINDWSLQRTIATEQGGISNLSFSPDSSKLLSNGSGANAKLWRVSDGGLIYTLAQGKFTNGSAFSPDGTLVATAVVAESGNVSLVLWRVNDGGIARTITTGAISSGTQLIFSQDGQRLLADLGGGGVSQWRVSDGGAESSFASVQNAIYSSLARSGDGSVLVAGDGNSSRVIVWRTNDRTVKLMINTDTIRPGITAFMPDGQHAFITETDAIKRINTTDGSVDAVMPNTARVTAFALSPSGEFFCYTTGSTQCTLARTTDGSTVRTFTSDDGIKTLAFSPDGQSVAAAGTGSFSVFVWRINDGTRLWKLTGHTANVESIVFSPDGTALASAGRDKTVRLWDLRTGVGQVLAEVPNADVIYAVKFSPGGDWLAAGNTANVYIVNLVSKTLQYTFLRGNMWPFTFSPDNELFMLGNGSFYRLADGILLDTVTGIKCLPTSVTYSPDGTQLLFSSEQGLELWKIDSRSRQPDLQVQNAGEVTPVGQSIYNRTGAGQTKAQLVAPGGTAVYNIILTNMGTGTDTVALTGPAGGNGWTTSYLDDVGKDITAAVTSEGGYIVNLPLGTTKLFRAQLSPSIVVVPTGTLDVLVTATSTILPDKADTVKLTTTRGSNPRTVRVSVSSGEVEGDAVSRYHAMSTDGRFVAFASAATTLVSGDTNGKTDIFVRDTVAGTTERVSVATDGTEANDDSGGPCDIAISADGRFVAFASAATNLIASDTNGVADIFVRDRQSRTTSRVSVGAGNTEAAGRSWGPAISGDGRYVAFATLANLTDGGTRDLADVYVFDRQLGTPACASRGTESALSDGASAGSGRVAISGDGRYVAFDSLATNLVAADTNGVADIFVRDMTLGTTEIASLTASGGQADGDSYDFAMSADARVIAFTSAATNLVDGDSATTRRLFVRNRQLLTTQRVSLAPDGTAGNDADALPALSGNGRFVAWASLSTNLVPAVDTNTDADIYVRDLLAGKTACISLDRQGHTAGGAYTALSGDGRFVTFDSASADVVPNDRNAVADIFQVDRGGGATSFLPDMLARNYTEIGYLGDGIYNDESWQTKRQLTAQNAAAVYHLKVQNDGTDTDTLVITGGGTGDGWTVKYFDALQGTNDITSDVLGQNGWRIALAPGASREFRVEVLPDDTVAFGATHATLVTAASAGNPQLFDTVVTLCTNTTLAAVSLSASPASPSVVGMPITLTATSNLAEGVEYWFVVKNGIATTDLQLYSSVNTCTWVPYAEGAYALVVYAREQGSSERFQIYRVLNFVVKTPVSEVGLTANPVTPTATGTPVRLTATPVGGAMLRYWFRVKGSTAATWTDLQAYSALNTCTWTPATADSYSLQVLAREVGSTKPYDCYKVISYVVKPALSAVSLAVSIPSPTAVGTPVRLTATATGGVKVQYAFRVKTGDVWSDLQSYGTSSSCIWTPTATGTFLLEVLARETGSRKAYDTYAVLSYTVKPAISALTFTGSLASPTAVGTRIKLTAAATGGARVQYAFQLQSGTGWVYLLGFGSTSTYYWVPQTAGTLTVRALAREYGNPQPFDASQTLTYTVNPAISAVALTTDLTAPSGAGIPVTVTATPTGGGTLQYWFRVRKDMVWSDLQLYTGSNTCQWTPQTPGAYLLEVMVKEVGSWREYDAVRFLHYTVAPALTAVALSADPGTPVIAGTPVTLTATATGGGAVQYWFRVSNGAAWTDLQAYGSSNTVLWTPTAGTYILQVVARDAGSTRTVSSLLDFRVQQ